MVAISFISELLQGSTPSANQNLLDRVKEIASGDQTVRIARRPPDELQGIDKVCLGKATDELRIHYLRWFSAVPDSVTQIITNSFGTPWMEDPSNINRIGTMRYRFRGMKDQWKVRCIGLIKDHVEAATEEARWMANANTHPSMINDFFLDCWSIEKAETLFFWAQSVVNYAGSSGNAQRFLCGELTLTSCYGVWS